MRARRGSAHEFSVYDTSDVLKGSSTQFRGPVDLVPPAGNGFYAEGKPAVTPPKAPNAAQAAQRDALATQLEATGWSPLVCTLVAAGG